MKLYISADLEGVSGVVDGGSLSPQGGGNYETARNLMVKEVNAAIEGALTSGAKKIIVNDAHGFMRNLLIEQLHPEARLITGATKKMGMMEGLDSTFDGVMLVGYHTMAGSRGVLAHSISGFTFAGIKINGIDFGEARLNAAIAGDLGVPVLMVSGDDCLKQEVKEFLPLIEFAQVKIARGQLSAECLHPIKARELIKVKAEQAVKGIEKHKPYVLEGPYHLEVTLKSIVIADILEKMPLINRVSDTGLSFKTDTLQQVAGVLEAMAYASMVLLMDK